MNLDLTHITRHAPRRHQLRQVLARPQELATAIQPIRRLRDRRIVGYEALARFPTGGRDQGRVESWFEAAGRQGLGVALEAAALSSALRRRAGLPRGCFLSANVSAAFLNTSAVRAVLEAAAPLEDVVIELTEQRALEQFEDCRAAVGWLRELGGRLAIDDLCAGYSGLRWLVELAPEFMKIDLSIVRDVQHDERRRKLVRSISGLGRDLDATVIAEGIEQAGELKVLNELGIPLGQGFLLGRPLRFDGGRELAGTAARSSWSSS